MKELPKELLSGTFLAGVVHGVCLEHFVTSRLQKSAIPHLSPGKLVEQLLWCLSAGYRGSVRTTNKTPFWHLPRGSCAWGVFGTLMSPAESKSQRFPTSAQKAGRTTFVVSFSWLSGQCKNYQQNSFLAPFPAWSCAWRCVWNILSPAESKSQRFPISSPESRDNHFCAVFQLATAAVKELPTELLSGTFPAGVVHGVCLEHFVTSRLQKSAIPHLSPESR